jgi:hypothetical protein
VLVFLKKHHVHEYHSNLINIIKRGIKNAEVRLIPKSRQSTMSAFLDFFFFFDVWDIKSCKYVIRLSSNLEERVNLTVLSTEIFVGTYAHNPLVSILLTGSRMKTLRRKNSRL